MGVVLLRGGSDTAVSYGLQTGRRFVTWRLLRLGDGVAVRVIWFKLKQFCDGECEGIKHW